MHPNLKIKESERSPARERDNLVRDSQKTVSRNEPPRKQQNWDPREKPMPGKLETHQ